MIMMILKLSVFLFKDPGEVHGSLSVLLDSALCAISPLLFLTSQIPEMNGCSRKTQVNIVGNVCTAGSRCTQKKGGFNLQGGRGGGDSHIKVLVVIVPESHFVGVAQIHFH